ncbi:serine threonine phosphatase 6 regulatory ankyrin repeat subunit B-like isoform X2 [Fusarium heterosporum]|uniref:Serine threonine phosphatase 6 regulatory ankyrin repeat subunit B-like isoform X2 n=1 Tax=Fusarium heterosporum TaxID=42747 RepID=A0A8H5TAI8_FUSHE|nr:serine threonine phosphatase 6 regulatory ankyrin repeat subunit B-like isoform X2 [Fusarium heterosporum]
MGGIKQTARRRSQERASRPAPNTTTLMLRQAVSKGNVTMLESLLKNARFEINKKDRDGLTLLHYAVINGQLQIFNFLLKNRALVSTLCSHGRALLHYAAWHGHLEIANVLLKIGVSIKIQDKDRRTALDFAIYYHRWELVQLLLEVGNHQWVSFQSQTQHRDSPRAAAIGDVAVISAMKQETETYPRNAMEVAALLGREDLIHRFVNEHGCHPQGCKEQGTSPMYVAVENGHHMCVETLVQYDADVNDPGRSYKTTLECALGLRDLRIAAILLGAGASIFYNAQDPNPENTTVALLAMRGPSMAAQLLSHIPSIEGLSSWLVGMARSKHVSILQEYFRNVAPNVQEKYGTKDDQTRIPKLVKLLIQNRGTVADRTRAIIAALEHEFIGVFFLVSTVEPEMLRDIQIKVSYIHDKARILLPSHINTQTDNNLITCLARAGYTHRTPLYDLCEAGKTTEVRERLEAGNEFVNALGPRNRTPLHSAAHQGLLDLVELLVYHGADLTARTQFGSTPIQLAEKRKHAPVVEFLKNSELAKTRRA